MEINLNMGLGDCRASARLLWDGARISGEPERRRSLPEPRAVYLTPGSWLSFPEDARPHARHIPRGLVPASTWPGFEGST